MGLSHLPTNNDGVMGQSKMTKCVNFKAAQNFKPDKILNLHNFGTAQQIFKPKQNWHGTLNV